MCAGSRCVRPSVRGDEFLILPQGCAHRVAAPSFPTTGFEIPSDGNHPAISGPEPGNRTSPQVVVVPPEGSSPVLRPERLPGLNCADRDDAVKIVRWHDVRSGNGTVKP